MSRLNNSYIDKVTVTIMETVSEEGAKRVAVTVTRNRVDRVTGKEAVAVAGATRVAVTVARNAARKLTVQVT